MGEIKNITGEVIDLSKLGQSSLLIIKCDRTPSEIEMGEIINWIRNAMPRGVNVIFVKKGFTFEMIPERTMNEMGWFRRIAGNA